MRVRYVVAGTEQEFREYRDSESYTNMGESG